MDGWNAEGGSDRGDLLAFSQSQEEDIPSSWSYARHFVLADHFFANMFGPSFPGHLMVLAAQAGGAVDNPSADPHPPYWGCDQEPGARIPVVNSRGMVTRTFPCFDIPSLEHPGVGSVCSGENWTVTRLNALMRSEYWNDTAVLFTMDDFGGFYDHVAPPRQYGGSPRHPDGLGMRLPLLVISPYARPGFVFHEEAEQASIPAFIERVFQSRTKLHDLDVAARDDVANDLLGAFNFGQTPLPPLLVPTRDCR